MSISHDFTIEKRVCFFRKFAPPTERDRALGPSPLPRVFGLVNTVTIGTIGIYQSPTKAGGRSQYTPTEAPPTATEAQKEAGVL